MNSYIAVLKKYAVFSGRARRSEYWYFVLFNLIITIALGFLAGLINDRLGITGIIYSLAVFIPTLAVSVRRLHDTNRSGWWVLIGVIPLIGVLVLIFFAAKDSDPGQNKYGPNPKGSVAEATN